MNISCIYPFKKIDEPYLSAIKEYEKRLGRYCKFHLHLINTNKKNIENKMVVYITSGYHIAQMPSSEEFANFIAQQGLYGNSNLIFILTNEPIIGKTIFSLSHAKLSPSILMVLLSEQIYRAFRIIHNHSYHK